MGVGPDAETGSTTHSAWGAVPQGGQLLPAREAARSTPHGQPVPRPHTSRALSSMSPPTPAGLSDTSGAWVRVTRDHDVVQEQALGGLVPSHQLEDLSPDSPSPPTPQPPPPPAAIRTVLKTMLTRTLPPASWEAGHGSPDHCHWRKLDVHSKLTSPKDTLPRVAGDGGEGAGR